MKQFFFDKKKRVENFLRENRMYALPTILVAGFIIDVLTLRQIDRLFDNIILLTHLLIVATTIILLFARNTRLGLRLRISERRSTISALMLFSFGGLFSGFVVFYSRSGSLISSWPFIFGMLLLMLGTEVRKKYYEKAVLQISIFYIALFSYLIFSVPVILKKMGPGVYLLSGCISLIVIYAYVRLLFRLDPEKTLINTKKIYTRIFSIFAIFNILYFTNIIPPIPLSMKFAAVYHDFSKIQAVEYKGSYEVPPDWQFWKKRNRVFHRRIGEPVYVYSEVYAPVNLSIDIYHRWEYFNTKKTRWVPSTEVRIPMTGGRAEGFRGYSYKSNIDPGLWRVKITTDRNQTIGQIVFKVTPANAPLRLREEVFR